MLDDAALLTAWRAGDGAKGERLFERHFDALYRFFSNKVDAHEVADLVQKTFLACLEASGTFEGRSSVRTYFFAVARHQLYHHYRTRRRQPELDFAVSSIEDLAPSPSSALVRAEQKHLLAEALRRIPLELQVALELRFIEELRGPELAHVLEIPEGTVRSRLRRGLLALRAEFTRLSASPADRQEALELLEPWLREVAPEE
jgi:RNA polymerase sigma-70 factor (ECF subfamily)